MIKSSINRAKERVEKDLRKSLIDRKDAAARCDSKSEMALSDKIEDYNTILWALEASQIFANDSAFGSHIMKRFERVN